jgi:hypothetical protein
MAWRFFRRFVILPWVRLNVSKQGASVTVGPQGATLTTGSSGTRVTLGLPGTGFFVTKKLFVGGSEASAHPWVPALTKVAAEACEAPSVAMIERVFAYQQQLGLTDADLPPELREALAILRESVTDPAKRWFLTIGEVLGNPHSTLADYYAVLGRQRVLGLRDEDLTPEMRETLSLIRARVADGTLAS